MRRSLVKLSRLVKSVTKMVTGCLKMIKSAVFVLRPKGSLAKYEKIGLGRKMLFLNFNIFDPPGPVTLV